MERRALLTAFAAIAVPVLARGADRKRRIAFLLYEDTCDISRREAEPRLRRLLAERGHPDVAVEWHCFGRDFQRAATLLADFARRRVDVIVTEGTPATERARAATADIPVMAFLYDPVAFGFTRNLGRPEGNVTGFANRRPDSYSMEVDLLRRLAPKAKEIVFITESGYPRGRELMGGYEAAATSLGMPHSVWMVDHSVWDRMFRDARAADAAVLLQFVGADYSEVAAAALRHGVPSMVHGARYVEHGGLMSLRALHENLDQKQVAMLDKLLQGVAPTRIPWELPERVELALNLRTARVLGLTVPADVRIRATQVID